MKIGWVVIVFLLVVFSLLQYAPVRATSAQNFSNVYLSPVSYNSTVGSFFTLKVMLNLTAGQNLSGFDVKLNYSNPQPTPVVRAVDLSYSGNIFGDANSNFVSQKCLFGVYDDQCPQSNDYALGWIHFSALSNSGNPVAGPLTALLFSVQFSVDASVKGTSLIRINTADLGNSGSGAFATTQFIPRTTEDAIFSNSGMAAFFNYLPTDTPSVVVGHRTIFDATGSFNASNPSVLIANYAWDFGDGSTDSSTNPVISHTFGSLRSYDVTLTVTDANGGKGSFHEFVAVGPPLGALLLTVYSLQKVLQSGVLVRIFNSSSGFSFANATTDSAGQVAFPNLVPGDYTLAFSGQYVKNSTATETIIAGWTTQGSVGIEVDTPPSPDPTPWYGNIVFLGSLGGAVGVFGLGLLLRRRRIQKKLRASRASSKRR